MELTREHVLKMISKRVVETVILSHHLSEENEPHKNYVTDKLFYEEPWPSLDKANSAIFEQINAVLRMHFGIEISELPYKFTAEDVEECLRNPSIV
jgi:hypothetical protein